MNSRGLIATAALSLLSACTSLAAVQTFSKTAPDQAKLDSLTDIYVDDPALFNGWKSLQGEPDPDLAAAAAAAERLRQKQALDQVNTLIVSYMKALGSLSNASLTDVSSQAKAVSSNLSKLNSAAHLGLNSGKIGTIGDLLSFVPSDILNAWRATELKKLLADNQAPFDALLDTEIAITARFITDFKATQGEIRGDIAFADANHARELTSRMARISLDRLAAYDIKTLAKAQDAAKSYETALQAIKSAYAKLVDAQGDFSLDTVRQLEPYLSQIEKAYTDLRKL